ncbi:DUF4391 domain-containing protein [Dialister invisus]|uniref:DUF4391 domain-containing protein n=1 Tax=Dialister invisus TaxID=218538 RepID=UPI0028D2E11A|nr:DUF4391 domain-containing protein [Dialister invisus]
MLSLPKSTEFNKRIPKQKFYEKLSVTPAIKKVFTEQIKMIYWRNKIAETTLNLAPGEQVTEIEIFEIRLNSPDLEKNVLRLIDREIPYHIVFLLEYAGKYQAWTSYKEASSRNIAFKVGIYYHTVWLSEEEISIRLDGLDLDTIYENFVRQIAGDVLSSGAGSSESLKESVERGENRRGLQRQIEVLEAKIKKEK